MSKEEFLKIQTCFLKVNIHCDGCKQKVKKVLQKIDGVYTIKIDSEQGKVAVSGNIDAAALVKKLANNGKHAEICGASKANNNHQNQLNNQFKNMHIDNGKGVNNKGQGQKNGGNNQPKGGPQPQPQAQHPQIQQLQQLQQLKGFQDLKIPPQLMKDMRMPINNKDQNQKSVKFSLPEDEDMTDDDDYDDADDHDNDDDDDYEDDEMDDMPMHNKKLVLGNGHGGAQIPNMMKSFVNAGNNAGGNLKGGSGSGNIPVQMNLGGANSGKKGGNGNNNVGNQNEGGGKGGKNGGGGHDKNGNGGGGGGSGAGNGSSFNANGAKIGGGMKDMHHGMMPNIMNVGQMGKNMPMPMGRMGKSMPMPMGQMGNLPMSQMGNLSAIQGLPASAANGGGAGYFPGGAAPEQMTRNPYNQQQLETMMMNQQRANGNERFHPMMYARPPPAVNYIPPYPPYPYPPPLGEQVDQYSMFSDENTSSCTVM